MANWRGNGLPVHGHIQSTVVHEETLHTRTAQLATANLQLSSALRHGVPRRPEDYNCGIRRRRYAEALRVHSKSGVGKAARGKLRLRANHRALRKSDAATTRSDLVRLRRVALPAVSGN